MGQSTYSGPVRAGTVRDGANANVGNVALTQSATLAFGDIAAKDLFTLPAGARITGFSVFTTTAFNAGTNNIINIRSGTTIIAAVTATGASITKGISTVVPVAAQVEFYVGVGGSDAVINAIFAPTGGAATTGAATIIVSYVQL